MYKQGTRYSRTPNYTKAPITNLESVQNDLAANMPSTIPFNGMLGSVVTALYASTAAP